MILSFILSSCDDEEVKGSKFHVVEDTECFASWTLKMHEVSSSFLRFREKEQRKKENEKSQKQENDEVVVSERTSR